jgi:DNA (cytosine-5)-methyltransferase 1
VRVFSTFTGIGGFEIGIENAAQGKHKVELVGYSEIDKPAISVFEKHYKGVKNYGDITKINAQTLPDFDCLVGGFPCQAFSIAGNRGGFSDTRGTLFFDLARILREKQPRLFVFENVKGLCNHDGGRTFRTILSTIDELGYDCQWQVLNSKDFGVPQNRERIIIVGHLRGTARPQVFPITNPSGKDIEQINKPKHSNDRIYSPEGVSPTLNTMQGGLRQPFVAVSFNRKKGITKKLDVTHSLQAGDYRGLNRNQNQTAVARPVITPDRLNKKQNGRRIKDDGEVAFTVTATDRHGVYDGKTIRRLTPLECERLQAFPDDWTKYDVDGKEISDTQRYKMAGNAVTTNVIQAVFEKILA